MTAIVFSCVGIGYIAPDIYRAYQESVTTINTSSPSDFAIDESSVIYDANNIKIATLKENGYSESIKSYSDIPLNVVNAFVSIEDRTFWDNNGISLKGISRSLITLIKSKGSTVTGGSTITQQLVRNKFLTTEKSYDRKFREAVMSIRITDVYTKEDIMLWYCNNINFGGIYGIANASRTYFGKSVDELTLSETAFLCAIPNRPTYYSNFEEHLNDTIKRRDLILNAMYECGYITQSDLSAALSEEIKVQPSGDDIYYGYEATYVIKYATEYLMRLSGFEFRYSFSSKADFLEYRKSYDSFYEKMRHELYTGGYVIHTDLDTALSDKLQGILDDTLRFDQTTDSSTGAYSLQGAIVVISNTTGKTVALTGGRSQQGLDAMYTLNRAIQAYRQPGSTIKPLVVYTPALESGYTANSKVKNIDTEAAKTADDPSKLSGATYPLRYAVEQSYNGTAWLLLDEITPRKGLSTLSAMRFSKIVPDDYNDAAALGGLTYGTTPEEMAGAYATLARGGQYTPTTSIVSITNSKGKEIYKETEPVRVYTEKASKEMKDILKGVAVKGTASKIDWDSDKYSDIFVKTGTTSKNRDGWLLGFSDSAYTIAVWVGYDIPKTLDTLTGSSYPLQIWKDSMIAALER